MVSGRWKFGLLLALTTAILWGVLPIALKGVMETLDPITTTFFRFSLAALLLTPYILLRSRHTSGLSLFSRLGSPRLLLQMLAAGLLLTANYALYILGLQRTTAEAAQIVIQAAPMLLLLSGVWLFGERLSKLQWFGCICFITGLCVFFSPGFYDVFIAVNAYGIGVMLILIAALVWTGYAIMQKFLLQQFSSQETMVLFYWIGTLAFLPFADFTALPQLSGLQWGLLAFCGLNTLIAYGSFAEAMAHIEASKVSAILALTPMVTVATVHLIPIPGLVVEPITLLTLCGAALVVGGSMLTALAKPNSA
ncbi:DMT family transporter [Porticoccaceae bacterium]|nr:DMT family transporter [Porticoccaceae bacterium]MDC1453528.1 DMT family transporter [Porticoccaceae bacterium]